MNCFNNVMFIGDQVVHEIKSNTILPADDNDNNIV